MLQVRLANETRRAEVGGVNILRAASHFVTPRSSL